MCPISMNDRTAVLLCRSGVKDIELGSYFVLSYAVVCMQVEVILLLALIGQVMVNHAYGSICPLSHRLRFVDGSTPVCQVVHRLHQIADTSLQLGRSQALATVECWGNVPAVQVHFPKGVI